MSENIRQAVMDKIKAYQRIMLFRHIRMDGDCVGASKGLKEMLRATFPEKEVLLVDEQHSDFLAFLGPDESAVPEETYRDALAIVVDTSEQSRIYNQKYALCREVIKIDHHIEKDPYGDLNWVEEERSAVCEMIADLYVSFRDQWVLTEKAATCLYLGMVTDSGRFRFSSVSGETMRLAGEMLDAGVDTERLYAQLYLMDYEAVKFKAFVYEHMERTENGVAYIHVTGDMRRQFGLSLETASSVVSYLENIKGCLCWLAFIDSDDPKEGTRVRLRSRFMTINQVAERHHGGGHACAAGATVYSPEEMLALIQEADEEAKKYKETHEGWL